MSNLSKSQREPLKKRVLLLNPYSDEYSDIKKENLHAVDEGRLFVETPLGLLYVYTYAKANLPDVEFHIIDAQALLIENITKGMDANWQMLMGMIRDIAPDVVGVGAYYFQSARLFHQTCKKIKSELPGAIIVAGGNYPTDAQDKVLSDKNVDYIVISEGERTFAEFLRNHFSGEDVKMLPGLGFRNPGPDVQVNPQVFIEDLSGIHIPDRSVLPMHVYGRGRNMLDRIFGAKNYRALSMTISRGCPFACKFCSAKNFWGRRIRYRDAGSVLDEMQELKERYGATVVVINDDNYLLNKAKASEIMRGMIERKLNIKWYAGGGTAVRVFLDRDYLDLAVRSGYCCFNLAIESSSDETLKRVSKPVRADEARKLVKIIRSRYPHLWIAGYFVVGFPFELKQDIINTFEFSRELELDWCTYSVFKLFPKTELYDEYIEQIKADQHISGDASTFETHYQFSSDILNINGLDWDKAWLFRAQYRYNLEVNFLKNRNITHGCYEQALRDFQYVMNIAPDHAIAYRQGALAAERLGNIKLAKEYARREREIMAEPNEFTDWYEQLGIQGADETAE